MKRNSHSRRVYGGRVRSPPPPPPPPPPPRREESTHRRIMIRNLPYDCRTGELRVAAEMFGPVKSVHIPIDSNSGLSRRFGFVEFVDAYDAVEAQRSMDGGKFGGREISVVFALEPDERHVCREPSGSKGRSHATSLNSPHHSSESRRRYRSRSYSPAPIRRGEDYSPSPRGRQEERPRSPPRVPPHGEEDGKYSCRSYYPGHEVNAVPDRDRNGDDEPRESLPRCRGYDGGREESTHRTLMLCNLPYDCRPEELRVPSELFGPVKRVYIPRDYYSGLQQGIAFVEFVNAFDAVKAQRSMDRATFGGKEIAVLIVLGPSKWPEEMHVSREPSGSRGRCRGQSHSRSVRSPHQPSDSRSRYRPRSYSPGPRRRGADNSSSPKRRQEERPRSPPRHPPRGAEDATAPTMTEMETVRLEKNKATDSRKGVMVEERSQGPSSDV